MMRRVLAAQSVLATFAFFAVFLGAVEQAAAQQPSYYAWNRNIIDYSDSGGDLSCFDRPHTSQIFYWGASLTPYLLADVANDLNLYTLSATGASYLGDADLGLGYNCGGAAAALDPLGSIYKSTDLIEGASVCPTCRVGIVHVTGSDWLVDFGTGTVPSFTSKQTYSAANFGATYKNSGIQFLWGVGANGELCGGPPQLPNPGVWSVSSASNVGQVSYCFQDRSYVPERSVQLANDLLLYYDGGTAGEGLRLATISASGVPQPLSDLVPASGPNYFNVSQPNGFGTYPVYVLTTQISAPPKVYRIDSVSSGFQNTLVTFPSGPAWSRGALSIDAAGSGFVYLFEATGSNLARRGLFQVAGLAVGGAPTSQEVDYSYWNSESSDFNTNLVGSTGALVESYATFAPGGGWLYFSRFRALQEFKYDPQAPQPPTAAGSVTVGAGQGDQSGNPFPGDTVTVSNTTVSTYDQSAIWITNQTGAVVAGSSVLSGSAPSSRAFTIPVDLAADVSYTAHVEVLDSTNFPDSPDEWTRLIAINRAPTASFTVTPTAVLTGESVALSAETDGSPGNPVGVDTVPYHWSVQPPTGAGCPSPFQDTGNGCFTDSGSGSLADVVLNGSGDYAFGLTVDYQHDQQGNLGVQYHAQAATQTASAAWGAPILSGTSPTSPTIDDNVSLRAFGSRLSDGMTVDYRYVLDGVNASGTGCSGQVTGGTGGSATVPDCAVGTLNAGQHSAQVIFTASDIDPIEVQSQSVPFNVTDTSMDFTWSLYEDNDNNGQINVGDVVQFTKTSGGTISSWNFGTSSCDGWPAQYDCSPTFPCNTVNWSFSSNNGTGNVQVSMTTTDGSVSHTIPVGSGSCPQSCSYSVSPSSISVGSAATTRSLSITNTQGCTWNVSEALSWITLSQTSGSGSATITVTFTANSSASTRNGTISVTGQDGFSRTVNVSQSGSGSSGSPSFSYQLSVDRDSNGSINVGDTVSFTSTGDGTVTGWSFGAADCDGTQPSVSCASMPCPSLEWTYGSSGTFTVTMNTSAGNATQSVSVGTGSCPSGSCIYSLSPTFTNVAASASSGTFTVNTGSDCSWSASSQVGWARVTSGSGPGPGTVSYAVDANSSGTSRQGQILVQGKTFTISQAAGGGGTESGPLLIPAAASVQGEGGTHWKSDLRIFNPASQELEITIQFVPQPGDETPYPTLLYNVDPSETIWIDDIMYWFTQGAAAKGALIITYDPADQGSPLITSRTYNQTDNGTFGQLIPVLSTSSLTSSGGKLYIPGVENSDLYRTNIGLVNTGTEGAGVTVTLIDHLGNALVHAPLGIPAETYMQLGLSAIAAQDPDALDITGFKGTVVVEVTNGGSVAAYGSVVDWTTGDPIFIEAVK